MGYSTLRRYAVTLDDSTAGSRKLSFLPYKVGTNVFATSSDWTPAAADFKVCKAITGSGLGAEASIGTAPTWVNGRVVIILSATELSCRYLTIRIENAAINSDEIIVETYGNVSAQYPTIYDGGAAGNLLTSGSGTDQLTVTAGRAAADVVRINNRSTAAVNAQIFFDVGCASGTYAGSTVTNTIDLGSLLVDVPVNAVFIALSSAFAIRGWGVINQVFSSTTTSIVLDRALANGIQNGDTWLIIRNAADTHETANSRSQVQVHGIDANAITATSIQANAITAAAIAAGALNGKGDWLLSSSAPTNFSGLGINASGHLSRVTLVDTLTTYTGNTVQTGDAFARLGAPAGASTAADIAAVKADTGNLVTRITSTLFSGITSLAQWLGLIAGKQVGNTTARTEIRATGGGSGTYDETTDSLEAARDAVAAGVTVTTNNDKTGYALTSGERDSIAAAKLDLAAGVETGLTERQLYRLVAAALAGKVDGAGTTTIHLRNYGDSKNRITATVDSSGNRTAISYDLT